MNNEQRKKRRRRDLVYATLLSITLLSMGLCALSAFLYSRERERSIAAIERIDEIEQKYENESVQEVDLYTQKEVDEKVKEGAEEREKEILDEMQSMIENGDGMLTLLQHFYPDHVIASSDGKYHFFPISDKLKKNDFIMENFSYPVEDEETGDYKGTASYRKKDGSYAKKGIDVSTFQGDIDWQKVKNDGIDYAIIRLGFRGYESGKIVLDKRYEQNIEGALAAGLDTGVYFFTESLTELEAIEEADFVIENLEGRKITMPVVIDVEESADPKTTRTRDLTSEQRTKNVIAFCNRIKEAGYEVMIYGNLKSFMLMMNIEELEAYDKWFAYYRYPFHFPYRIKMWQYASWEKVDGVQGDCDVNLMFY